MYILDTNALYALGNYYPKRFPTIWKHIDQLADAGEFASVKEVRREIEHNCPFPHIEDWVKAHRFAFRKPDAQELEIVADIFKHAQFIGLVRATHIKRGLPVADPFLIAAAKVHDGILVTQESHKKSAARIPTICEYYDVKCINVEQLLEMEGLEY